MGIDFSTKAQNLKILKDKIKSARIAPLYILTVEEWLQNPESIISNIKNFQGNGPFIVRSSSRSEDGENSSNAGAFLSLVDVSVDDLKKQLTELYFL